MKAQVGDPPRVQVLPALTVALAILLTSNVAVVSGDSYGYKSPPPPSPSPLPPYHHVSPPPPEKSPPPPYYYHSPPPPSKSPPPYYYKSPPPPYYHEPIVKVVGKVYCYKCYDWKKPVDSHVKKLFEGAIVKVTCKAGSKAYEAYGETKSYGKYSVVVKDFPYSKYGAEACKVELHAAPKGSTCNIPTDLNKGAKLKVDSKSYKEVVLMAKPLAFAPEKPSEECYKLTPPYYYKSPPPPAKSPPRPYHYVSPPPPEKSPPPPYFYHSPPPPMKSTPHPYVYKSPPPPSPSPPPPSYHYNSPPPPYH